VPSTSSPSRSFRWRAIKERTSRQSQTLTGLGKWWGRKPLVLVRACLLGLLMPPSTNPTRDKDSFLKLMTMDAKGLQLRKTKHIPPLRVQKELAEAPPSFRNK